VKPFAANLRPRFDEAPRLIAMPRVAIIGGGITGLAAAYRLRELRQQGQALEAIVLEAGDQLGGPIRTRHENGFLLETGADSFVTDKPWALNLARRLGLDSQLLGTGAYRKTLVVCRGRLQEIPTGFNLMAPARLMPMLKSPILSWPGKLRLLMEPLIPARRGGGDESLASFVRRRMGRELLERLAQPLAGGIYTADPARLSLHATLPRFAEMERAHGSVVRGLRAAARNAATRQASGARWSLFLTCENGMQTLIDALAAALGDCVRRRSAVRELTRQTSGRGWNLRLDDGATLCADAVICAIPAPDAGRLLAAAEPGLARLLVQLRYSSAAVVNLAYRESDFANPPRATGFVVPFVEGRRIIAASFSSIKFAGRAPAGHVLLRVFLGGTLQQDMLRHDDDTLARFAREEIAGLLGVKAPPRLSSVTRWDNSMAQYAVGHLDWADAVQGAARKLAGLFLAGAAYRGVGIPDCIHSGELAAEAAAATLGMGNIAASAGGDTADAPR
jgi:oxygen-dependent protoporphyrinogen oxidase